LNGTANLIPHEKATTIAILIAEFATVTIPVIILGKQFNFPDILRKPAKDAFSLFHQHQPAIIAGYYLFLLSSLLYIPLCYTLAKSFSSINQGSAGNLLIGLGIVTAVFQVIGLFVGFL